MGDRLQQEEQPIGAPAWVLPYGDMMTLLLACFVMLAAMSEIKEEKRFQATADSLRGRFGDDGSLAGIVGGWAGSRQAAMSHLVSAGRARRAEALGGGDTICAPLGEDLPAASPDGFRNATPPALPFDAGSAALREEGRRMLAVAAQEVIGKSRQIEIRGRASLQPSASNAKKSPWDLTSARCAAAMQYLVKLGISPKQVRLTVVADNQPRQLRRGFLWSSDEGSVEVLIRPEPIAETEEISEEEQQERVVARRPQQRI